VRRWIVILIVVAAAAAAYWMVKGRGAVSPPPGETAGTERVRVVTIYFGSSDGESLVPERRIIPSSESVSDNLRNVIEALISGPTEGGTATLPASVRVRGIFINDKEAVIDFSKELVDDFAGGTTAEYLLISSLVETVCANFPQVEAVRILVDGEEVETIGGHLSAVGPLEPGRWR
jgi:spore germination protein GerM